MESQTFTLEISDFEDKLLPTVLDNMCLKILKDKIVTTFLWSLFVYTSQSIKDLRTRKSKETVSLTAAKFVFTHLLKQLKSGNI